MMNAKEILDTLGITRDDVVNVTAEHLIDSIDCISAEAEIRSVVSAHIKKTVAQLIDKLIETELESVMTNIITKEFPVLDQWGEATGKKASIRDRLAESARVYWSQKVDASGNPSVGYHSKQRHEYLFGKIVEEEFSKAIAQNYTNIIGALKDSMKADAVQKITEHIDSLIKVKTSKG